MSTLYSLYDVALHALAAIGLAVVVALVFALFDERA